MSAVSGPVSYLMYSILRMLLFTVVLIVRHYPVPSVNPPGLPVRVAQRRLG